MTTTVFPAWGEFAPACLLACLLAGTGTSTLAQVPAAQPGSSVAVAAAPSTDGDVRRIDKEQGKITLKHAPIESLDMPGMTMVFKVADPAMLDRIQEGDKVRFAADRVNGVLTVTAIELAK